MNRKFLVSEVFEQALTKYFDKEKKGDFISNSDGYLNIIRCLIFIYGDLDFINPKLTKDTKALIENLSKFGYSKSNIYNFFDYFNSYDLFNISKSLIDMYKNKKDVLVLDNSDSENFLRLLKNIVNIESNMELYDYYENILKDKNEIEILEIEPLLEEKEEVNKGFSFQLDDVNGFVSIISILIFIAIVCFGIIVINVLVG